MTYVHKTVGQQCFLLLLFMVALVFTNSNAPAEVDTIKLPNIFHTPTVVEPVLDRDPIPVYAAQPEYPARALTRGISGYAVVSLTISPTGAARDRTLIAESPEGYGFGKAALKAAGKLKYQPCMVDGEAMAVPGVTFRYSFNLEE